MTHNCQFTVRSLLVFVALAAVLCGVVVVVTEGPRKEAIRARCNGKLKMLGVAFQAYHEVNGCFPPAYVTDESGQRMHSWRVLLLPYLGYKDLYERYDLNEPWDGPNNSNLAKETVWEYRCPACESRDKTLTSYVAVVGEGTAWPGSDTVGQGDFLDGCHNTILLVEISDSKIKWIEPRDVPLDQVIRKGLPEAHPGGVNCLFADGSVGWLSHSIGAKRLRALLTIRGDDDVKIAEP